MRFDAFENAVLSLIMEPSEDIKETKDILQNIMKAKKAFRMYPPNNPIYTKTLEDAYTRFREYFDYKDALSLQIKQHSIIYDSEQVYYNPEKEDNLALFFFKDGLRELTFKKGLMKDELEDFLKIIALDFDRDVVDDDVVTLLWERDFQNIQYVVDESFLVDIEEEDYGKIVEERVKEKVTDVSDLMRAYSDGFKEEDVKGLSIVPLSDKDLQHLVKEIELDSHDKMGKLFMILFELTYKAEDKNDLEDAFAFLKEAIRFSMEHGDLYTVLEVMKRANEIIEDPLVSDEGKKYMKLLNLYLGTDEIISLLAEILDSGVDIEVKAYEEFVRFLDKNAIRPFVRFLGELKTIRARRSVIDALIILGKKDIQTLAKGLEDHRWYVVRNIIYILRKIGDRRAIEYLLKIAGHGDTRVRKEVIKAFGELGGKEVVQTLKERLNDTDMQVRISAAKAFGNIGTEVAKKIILEKISDKSFKEKSFEEKKEFFEVLLRWKDNEIFDFLMNILKKRVFFGRAKNAENKACAAFCLGLLGNKDALPALIRLKDSGNRIIKEFAQAAVRRLEYGQ